MGLIINETKVALCSKNIDYYKDLGYEIPKTKDNRGRVRVARGTVIKVKATDLGNNSHNLVQIKCDGIKCTKTLSVQWRDYLKYVKEDGKYYCNVCGKHKEEGFVSFEQWCNENDRQDILIRWDYDLNDLKPTEVPYSSKKKIYFRCAKEIHVSELKSITSITSRLNHFVLCNQCNSFEQWCIDNNRRDILDRWDYELNDKSPIEISHGLKIKYWFKCPRGIHESELKSINNLTTGKQNNIDCIKCNSFSQWGIDNLGENFLDLYWDDEKNININPWEISHSSYKKVFIKCQKKKYHDSYDIYCCNFVNGERCSYCANRKVHPLDSLAQHIIDNHGKEFLKSTWSDKNIKSLYEYPPNTDKKIWWKCPNGRHEDYYKKISDSNTCKFRCPECAFSKGEKKIEEWLLKNSFKNLNKINIELLNKKDKSYKPQKEFDGLIGLKNGNLSYDFYLPQYNLLIEYQGEMHERFVKGIHKSIKDFENQQEHDRRKKEYAEDNNIELLPIWYWDFDDIDKILELNLSPNSVILQDCNDL